MSCVCIHLQESGCELGSLCEAHCELVLRQHGALQAVHLLAQRLHCSSDIPKNTVNTIGSIHRKRTREQERVESVFSLHFFGFWCFLLLDGRGVYGETFVVDQTFFRVAQTLWPLADTSAIPK